MSDHIQTVAEITFPSGVRHYSVRGILDTLAYYKELMVEAGVLTRSIPALPGRYRASEIDLKFWNRSSEFSALKATDGFYNAQVRVLRSITGGSLATIAQGFLTQWELANKVFHLRAADLIQERLSYPIDHGVLVNLEREVFPDLPVTQAPVLVPLPYGKLELEAGAVIAGTGPGVVPCYLIDPAIGQSKYRYVCAQTVIHSVIRVFQYETLVTTGYTVTTAVYGGLTMTVIDFDADPRIASRARDLEVTCDLWGVASGGTVIENPANQIEHFIENFGPAGLTVSMATAIADCNTRLYKAAWCLLDNRWTYQDVLDRMGESFLMPIYPTRAGAITAHVVTEEPPTVAVSLSETMHILQGTFKISSNRDLASRIRYETHFHWTRAIWQRRRSLFIEGEEAVLGREVIRDLKLWFVRDAASAAKIARAYGSALREATQYVDFEIEPTLLETIDLNTAVGLTHREGIGASGYVDEPLRVLQADYYPSPKTARIFIRGIIIPEPVVVESPYTDELMWALAPVEQVVLQSELTTAPYATDSYFWGLHVGGREYGGGRSSLRRGLT